MSEEVLTAMIGLGGGLLVAVLTAVYTVGGRGALLRREIKQEAEIASLLPQGRDKDNLEAQVSSRLAVYRARLVPYGSDERRKLLDRRTALVAGFGAVFLLSAIARLVFDGSWEGVVTAVFLAAYLGTALSVGAWLGVHWRGLVLWRQREVHRQARERMALGRQPFGVPSAPPSAASTALADPEKPQVSAASDDESG